MKRIVVLFLLLVSFSNIAVSGASLDFTLDSQVINVLEDELIIKMSDVAPVCIDGIVLLPLRIAAESFGASVMWDDKDRMVKIVSADKNISFTVGECDVMVNDDFVTLDVPTVIIQNRTMVSLQFLEKCLGYYVRKIEVSDQILLTNDKPVMRVDNSYIHFDEVNMLFDADKDKYSGEEDLLTQSCISNLFDTAIMHNAAIVKQITFTEEDKAEIMLKVDEDKNIYKNSSLKSVYTYILSKRKLADKFSDILSSESIPSDEEIKAYFKENFQGNEMTNEQYEELRYLLGYEKFVENWNELYVNTDDEMFYDVSNLTELLKK